jgi:hypothetical protein
MDITESSEKKTLFKRGNKLEGLGELEKSLVEKSNELKKKKKLLEMRKDEIDNLNGRGKPKEEQARIRRLRAEGKKEIKKLEKDIHKLASESKDVIPITEREKLSNLARRVSYPVLEFEDMDVLEFEKHRKNLLYFAARNFDSSSKIATQGLITVTSMLEAVPKCKGCSKALAKNRGDIEDKVNKIFIDLGMNDVSPTDYINPYSALAIALASPVIATVISNIADEKKQKKPLSQPQKKSSISLKSSKGSISIKPSEESSKPKI